MERKILLVLLLASGPALGQVLSPADQSLQVLRVPVDARAAGMGEAFSAVADDPGAVYWDPAGLSQVRRAAASLAYDSWLVGSSVQDASLAVPTWLGTFGFRAAYVSYGSFEQRDNYGNLLAQALQPDGYCLAAAFGTEIEFFSIGAALKYSRETIGTFVTDSVGADVGLLFPVDRLRFAAGVRGMDLSDTYRSAGDFYGGASYQVEFGDDRLLFSAEGNLDALGQSNCGQGLEFMYRKTLFLRGGAFWDLGGIPGVSNLHLTGGIGVALNDVNLDYAVADHGELGIVNRVTLGYQFGGTIPKPVKARKGPEDDAGSVPDIQVLQKPAMTPSRREEPAAVHPAPKTGKKKRGRVIREAAPEPTADPGVREPEKQEEDDGGRATPVPEAPEGEKQPSDHGAGAVVPTPTIISLDDGSIKDITPR